MAPALRSSSSQFAQPTAQRLPQRLTFYTVLHGIVLLLDHLSRRARLATKSANTALIAGAA